MQGGGELRVSQGSVPPKQAGGHLPAGLGHFPAFDPALAHLGFSGASTQQTGTRRISGSGRVRSLAPGQVRHSLPPFPGAASATPPAGPFLITGPLGAGLPQRGARWTGHLWVSAAVSCSPPERASLDPYICGGVAPNPTASPLNSGSVELKHLRYFSCPILSGVLRPLLLGKHGDL